VAVLVRKPRALRGSLDHGQWLYDAYHQYEPWHELHNWFVLRLPKTGECYPRGWSTCRVYLDITYTPQFKHRNRRGARILCLIRHTLSLSTPMGDIFGIPKSSKYSMRWSWPPIVHWTKPLGSNPHQIGSFHYLLNKLQPLLWAFLYYVLYHGLLQCWNRCRGSHQFQNCRPDTPASHRIISSVEHHTFTIRSKVIYLVIPVVLEILLNVLDIETLSTDICNMNGNKFFAWYPFWVTFARYRLRLTTSWWRL